MFALEEDDDPEDMVAMMEHSQWTGRGTTEPNMPLSLQQMFALARRMGYELRPIAHRTGTTRQTPSSPRMMGQVTGQRSDRDMITRRSSASAAVIWDTHRPGAPNRIHHFHSGRMVGTHSRMVHDNALMDHNRETTYRPRPRPHRSARNSLGPHLILILHIGKFFRIIKLTHC